MVSEVEALGQALNELTCLMGLAHFPEAEDQDECRKQILQRVLPQKYQVKIVQQSRHRKEPRRSASRQKAAEELRANERVHFARDIKIDGDV